MGEGRREGGRKGLTSCGGGRGFSLWHYLAEEGGREEEDSLASHTWFACCHVLLR